MLKTLKIGCYEYKVKEVECVNKYESRAGEIDFFKRRIKLDKDMCERQKNEILLHEAIHGLEEFMGFVLEEEVVSKLGKGLAMVFYDNPELIKQFTTSNKTSFVKLTPQIKMPTSCTVEEVVEESEKRLAEELKNRDPRLYT